jgi:hypothetical protein
MAQIFNEQRVRGIRLVSDGTTMYLGRRVIGVRNAGAALFIGNLRTVGVDVLAADKAIHNGQEVVGAVLISDARTIYNSERIIPVAAQTGVLA